MRTIHFILVFLFYASAFFAQESPVKTMISAFEEYSNNHPVEKIYLQLDKPYYAAGETMYFRAYLTDMDLSQDSVASKIIYVELSDTKKNLVKRILLYSEQQEFAGQILLSDSLPSAYYHLRAYTNWMRNAGEDYFFHRDIYIGNASEQKIITPQAFDYQVSFFPEGGQLLAGFSDNIAFKALGNDGFGTEVRGILSDSEGEELLKFNSRHFGMGSFNFTPEKGKTYKVSVQSKGIAKEYSLTPISEGITLSAHQDERSIYLTIRSTIDEKDSIYIIGQSRNTVYYTLNGMTKGREQQIVIDKAKFPAGIAQFTLFKDGHPVSERLLFIDREDALNIDIIPDKEEYGDREKATVQILVTDSFGDPVEGSFSLSVTDNKTVQPSINEQNIKGSLLLDSDLKGTIESPGWYFSGNDPERLVALDNLLCTQGWSRFVWDKITATSVPAYPAENEFKIIGKVTNLFGQPVKEASIILFSKDNVPGKATTNKDGRFSFYGLNCPEGTAFVLQCRTKREGKAGIGFALDKPDNQYVQTKVLPLIPIENKKLIEAYLEQAGRWINEEGKQIIRLPEVKVVAKKVSDRESIGFGSYRFGGKTLDRPYPIETILQTLPSPTRGVISVFSTTHVLYVVDGFELDLKNGLQEFKDVYGSMPANMFESVEVLKDNDSFDRFGFDGIGGAYVFTTKISKGNYEIPDASIEVLRPEFYD